LAGLHVDLERGNSAICGAKSFCKWLNNITYFDFSESLQTRKLAFSGGNSDGDGAVAGRWLSETRWFPRFAELWSAELNSLATAARAAGAEAMESALGGSVSGDRQWRGRHQPPPPLV